MGHLYYGGTTEPLDIPDRLLAHVKVVVATKLRRGESFTMSWRHPEGTAPGRSTIWLQPAIPVRFVFGSAEPETLDPALLKTLADQSHSAGGLTVDLAAAEPARPDTLSVDTQPIDIVSPAAAA